MNLDILRNTKGTEAQKSSNLGVDGFFRMDNDPKHTSSLVAEWFKDIKMKGLERLFHVFYKDSGLQVELNLTQLHQNKWTTFTAIYCERFVEGYPS